jgi:adenylosuccinate synthase
VLNDFETIKMCNNYLINGQRTQQIPFEFNSVEIKPVFDSYPGWRCELQGTATYNELPENALNYLKEIELAVNTPIKAVSISPDRKDVLFR